MLLEEFQFPEQKRYNISPIPVRGFVLGEVYAYRYGPVLRPSKHSLSPRFAEIYNELKKLMKMHDPSFKYSSIQVNKSSVCNPHVDMNNLGTSFIVAVGNFTGGKLNISGRSHNIKNKMKEFHGQKLHYAEPFKGTRYSIVFFKNGKGRWKELAKDKLRFPRDPIMYKPKVVKKENERKRKNKKKS
jgi:hypothetical protein